MRKVTSIDKVPYPAPDVITKVIPAPTEGWDAISPLADMSPNRAVFLENWVPRPGFIENRRGYINWVTSTLGSPVETLMVYEQPSVVKMFAATASGSILDVTASATTASVFATVFATGRWQWLNYTPAGAPTVMQMVNGTDSLQQIAGTVITSVSITNLSIVSSTLTTANFINIAAVKRRIWYVVKNSSQAVFMPTDAISGPIAGYLDLGALWRKGGSLVAIANWTIDGGAGPDDYTVFISSKGQLTVFTGIDPTTNSWALKGTFDVAPPIGNRCFYRFGSDLLIITQQGVLPISQALPFDPSADRSTAVTLRIQNAMIQSAQNYGSNFGWELISYPAEGFLFLNVPVTVGGSVPNAVDQYVQNVITGAWCHFMGWNANSFAVFNNNLYFGDRAGNVQWAYQTGSDGGNSISANLHCAFNWYDNPGRLKRITLVQPLLTIAGGTPHLGIAACADFHIRRDIVPVETLTGSGLWDVAKWDVDVWGGVSSIGPWISVNAVGKAISFFVGWTFNSQNILTDEVPVLQINAFNTVAELGGMI